MDPTPVVFDEDFDIEALDEAQLLLALQQVIAMGIDLSARIKVANGGNRELSIVATKLDEAGLWAIADMSGAQGSSITDGLRGI